MTGNKKTPLRMCVITKEKFPKQQLIRIVRTPEGQVELDVSGRKNGRGAYIKLDVTTIRKAKKTKRLERHLSAGIPETVYEQLERLVSDETTST